MKNQKRILSIIVVLTMLVTSMSSVIAFAQEEVQTQDKLEVIRQATNMYKLNYSFEHGDITDIDPELTAKQNENVLTEEDLKLYDELSKKEELTEDEQAVFDDISFKKYYGSLTKEEAEKIDYQKSGEVDDWTHFVYAGGTCEFDVTDKQSYSGDYSAVEFNKTGTSNGFRRLFYYNKDGSVYNPNKTYIHSAKILGTKANKDAWDALAPVYKTGQYAYRVRWDISSNKYLGQNPDLTVKEYSNTDGMAGFRLDEVASDITLDGEHEKLPKSAWKDMYAVFEIGENVPSFIGAYIYTTHPTLELYSDDYYMGELMVADIVDTTETHKLLVPAKGMNAATVELGAYAVNQLGNTAGLDGTTYTWNIKGTNPQGVSLSGTTLTIDSSAEAQDVVIEVTANPTFLGADTQTADITAYRTKEIVISLEKAGKLETLRSATNLYGTDYGFESGTVTGWSMVNPYVYGTINIEASNAQSYSGDYSAAIYGKTQPHLAYTKKLNYDDGNVREGATYITSAKVLGTEENLVAREGDMNKDNAAANKFKWTNPSKNSIFTYVKGTEVLPADLATAPAYGTENQTKLGSDAWTDFTAGFTSNATIEAGTTFELPYIAWLLKGVEYYIDDVYFGELFVADVEVTGEDEITLPLSGTKSVTLAAKALNQLGTDYMLEDTTYTWEIKDAPEGVSIDNGILTVNDTAKAGNIAVSVTANPVFAGAETQSDMLRANRTAEFVVTLKSLDSDNLLDATNWFGEKAGFENASIDSWMEYKGYGTNYTKGTINLSDAQSYSGEYSGLVKQGVGVSGARHYFYSQWYEPGKSYIASAKVLGTVNNQEIFDADTLKDTQWEPKVQLDVTDQVSGAVAGDGNYIRVCDLADAPDPLEEEQEKMPQDKWQELYRIFTISDTEPAYVGPFVRYNPGNLEIYTDDYYIGELMVADIDVDTREVVIPSEGTSDVVLGATALNQLGHTAGLADTAYTWEADLPHGVYLTDGMLTVTSEAKAQDIVLTVTAHPTFAGSENQSAALKAYRTKDIVISLRNDIEMFFDETESGVIPTVNVINTTEEDISYTAYLVSYGENGVSITALPVNAKTGESLNITFDAIAGGNYKLLLWNNDIVMKPVISSVAYSK